MSKPHRLKNLRLDEISLVDRPANALSKISIWKRDTQTAIEKADRQPIVDLCKSAFDGQMSTDFRQALSDEMERQRLFEVEEELFPLMDALRESTQTSAINMTGEDRDQQIRDNVEAFLSAVRSRIDGETMEKSLMAFNKADHEDMSETEKSRFKELLEKEKMSEKDARAKVVSERTNKNAGSPGDNPSDNKGDTMSEDTKKQLGDLKNQVDQLTKQFDTLAKQAESHGLSVKKSEDGSVSVQKAEAEEYVEVGGEKVAKSAVPAPVLKQIEFQNDQIRKMQERQESEDLRKRAETEIPNLKGTPDQRGALLKSIDSIADEESRKAVMETLKSADAISKSSFQEIGKSAADDDSSATSRLNKMATDHASKQGISFHQAFAEVTKDDSGKQLLTESRRETPAS